MVVREIVVAVQVDFSQGKNPLFRACCTISKLGTKSRIRAPIQIITMTIYFELVRGARRSWQHREDM